MPQHRRRSTSRSSLPKPEPEPKPSPEPEPTSPPKLEIAPEPETPSEPAAVAPADPETTPEPEPTPVVAAPSGPPSGLDLAAIDSVWPQLISKVREEAGPRRFALFRETRPVGVEGGTLILGIGAHLPFHLAQLQEDDRLTSVVTNAAGGLLGGVVKIEYRPVNGESEPAAKSPVEEEIPEKTPSKDELTDTGEGAIEAVDLIVDMLDGEVQDD